MKGSLMQRGLVILALTASFSVAGTLLKPSRLQADLRPPERIESVLSQDFGGWKLMSDGGQVVNPQANALINRIYAETVNRRFVDAQGNVVMLAVAYGRDQSDSLQVHEPMVCYPSQGFKVQDHHIDVLQTQWGTIPVHRLVASMGRQRIEPVTYWTTLGDRSVDHGTLAKKRIKFDYSLQGLVPDGLLFRVSTLDADPVKAFAVQDRFVNEYLAQVTPQWRLRLAGL